jgi:CBS-domain-containing membrane protein
MWEGDCGILPIVDDSKSVLGVITDRDICMAVVTKARPADQIAAREVHAGKVFTCKLDDDVKRALEIMRAETVRRLPVVDSEGRLQGIISLNDLALASRRPEQSRGQGVTHEDLVPTLQAISGHRKSDAKAEKASPPAPARIHEAAAAAK